MKKKNENQVEEIKEETVAEETVEEQVQETKVEETPVQQEAHMIYINKEEKPADKQPLEEIIEQERSGLFKTYRSTMTRNNILLLVVAAVFITGFFTITTGTIGAIIGWSLIGVTMVGMIIYYIYNRKLYPTK